MNFQFNFATIATILFVMKVQKLLGYTLLHLVQKLKLYFVMVYNYYKFELPGKHS